MYALMEDAKTTGSIRLPAAATAWKTPAALNFTAWRSGRTLLSPDAPKLFRNLPPGLARILPLPRPEASRYDKGQRGSHSLSP